MTGIDLTGKKAMVTGAAQGLGQAMAQALSTAGADVAVADLQDELGPQAADALARDGRRSTFVHLDVTDDVQWANATARVVEELGGLDIVVNNAGIEITGLVIDVDPEHITRMNEVNIRGTLLGVKHAFRAMKPGGIAGAGGSVVNVASVAATIAFPGIAGYSATKSAVDRLTRVAAAESGAFGYDVRVNCVYPGLIPTAMGQQLAGDVAQIGLFESPEAAVEGVVAQTPLGRLGTPDEIADVVAFLASDAARFMTGSGLAVDGGMGM